jgi:hypothetical protein
MTPSDFWFNKLGKMINDPDYDLNERFAPRLLNWGYIEFEKDYQSIRGFHITCSYFLVTDKGKKAYFEWEQRQLGKK